MTLACKQQAAARGGGGGVLPYITYTGVVILKLLI